MTQPLFEINPKVRSRGLKLAAASPDAKMQQIEFSRSVIGQIKDNLKRAEKEAVKEDRRVIRLKNELILEERHLNQLRKVKPKTGTTGRFGLRRRRM